jgi:prolyl oligopeptidase
MRYLLAAALMVAAPVAAAEEDPHLWLEEVQGPRALAQVEAWNAATAKRLTAEPGFEAYRSRALTILNDPRQLAYPDDVRADGVTNFWRDAVNTHGLWRIASTTSFRSGKPEWRTLLDLDALSKAEGRNWVWGGVTCLKPAERYCIVELSDGGKDATEAREFDTATGRFVEGGFRLPTAKTTVAWAGPDALLVQTDFGPGTLTDSGYGRQVKLWRRGTPLSAATLVAEGKASDVAVSPRTISDGTNQWPMVLRAPSFWEVEASHVAPDGRLVKSPLPLTAEPMDVIGGRMIALLHADWNGMKAGSLVAYEIAPLLAGKAASVETVFAPSASQAIEEVRGAKGTLWVKLLDNVAGKLLALTRGTSGWSATPMPLPANSVVSLLTTGGADDAAYVSVEGLAQPGTLLAVTPAGATTNIAALPAFFDAAKVEVSQRFATSKDGTRIPYFLVRPKGVGGPLPTLMHAYGGFRAATNPTYLSKNPSRLGPLGQFWVEEGGAFVLANIRGGGEFGPAWHESVLKENRQKVFDDLHAVAEELKASGVTSKLGVSGRSNGGLLVGVAYTQRPELYDAVLMGVPLSDMKRYNKLLAGASWMGEYGDPDKPEEWTFISRYSPYQNLRAGADYPNVMIYTSTKDDRVHPGHARKMAARMAEQGHAFEYYENTEGGHAGAANKSEDAYRAALMLVYLNRELRR